MAHHGLHDATRPENVLAAFEAAAQAGHPSELDVHRIADGKVVVFHGMLSGDIGYELRAEQRASSRGLVVGAVRVHTGGLDLGRM